MSPATLVETLLARGVTLEVRGDRLKVRPASAVTADEVEALRRHKAEVLGLLTPAPPGSLDMRAVRLRYSALTPTTRTRSPASGSTCRPRCTSWRLASAPACCRHGAWCMAGRLPTG